MLWEGARCWVWRKMVDRVRREESKGEEGEDASANGVGSEVARMVSVVVSRVAGWWGVVRRRSAQLRSGRRGLSPPSLEDHGDGEQQDDKEDDDEQAVGGEEVEVVLRCTGLQVVDRDVVEGGIPFDLTPVLASGLDIQIFLHPNNSQVI